MNRKFEMTKVFKSESEALDAVVKFVNLMNSIQRPCGIVLLSKETTFFRKSIKLLFTLEGTKEEIQTVYDKYSPFTNLEFVDNHWVQVQDETTKDNVQINKCRLNDR